MLDIAVLALLCFFSYNGYKNGLIKSLLKLTAQLVALIFTYTINPIVSILLRQTGLYDMLKQSIIKTLGLNEIIATTQANFINQLELPDFLKTSLLANNNPEVYKILNVSGIENYVSGYLANICINILSLISAYLIINVVLKIFIEVLDIAARLPIIKQLNDIGGLISGFFLGIIIIWIVFIFMTVFITLPIFDKLYTSVNDSTIALLLYRSNILLSMILKVFA